MLVDRDPGNDDDRTERYALRRQSPRRALSDGPSLVDGCLRIGLVSDLRESWGNSVVAIEDWELWACANEMIRQHGEDATTRAAMRADELLEAGDRIGAATWKGIMDRIEELVAAPPERLN